MQATSFLALCVNVACSDVLQAARFFWVAHEQGLTEPVVSPVQIKGMIFALVGFSLQACVSIIFSYLTTAHHSNAELTGFLKFSVKHCHTSLAWPITSGQWHLGWYWAVKRLEGPKIMALVLDQKKKNQHVFLSCEGYIIFMLSKGLKSTLRSYLWISFITRPELISHV